MIARDTYQRGLILHTIMCLDHPSAEEIYKEIQKYDVKIGRATVFRTLNHLTSTGKILKIHVPSEGCRYDAKVKEHVHFKCDRCQKIFDIDPPFIETPNCSHTITGYDLIFRGLCKCCLEKIDCEE